MTTSRPGLTLLDAYRVISNVAVPISSAELACKLELSERTGRKLTVRLLDYGYIERVQESIGGKQPARYIAVPIAKVPS